MAVRLRLPFLLVTHFHLKLCWDYDHLKVILLLQLWKTFDPPEKPRLKMDWCLTYSLAACNMLIDASRTNVLLLCQCSAWKCLTTQMTIVVTFQWWTVQRETHKSYVAIFVTREHIAAHTAQAQVKKVLLSQYTVKIYSETKGIVLWTRVPHLCLWQSRDSNPEPSDQWVNSLRTRSPAASRQVPGTFRAWEACLCEVLSLDYSR